MFDDCRKHDSITLPGVVYIWLSDFIEFICKFKLKFGVS